MHVWLPLLLFFRLPFWEAHPAELWTDRQIDTVRFDSPWAQKVGPDPSILVWLATAAPVEEAEAEARVRGKVQIRERDPDYAYYLVLNRERNFVLAISLAPGALAKRGEEARMLEESAMILGGKRHRIVGYFPPTAADPVLRLVFEREVKPADKRVLFRLYVPGIDFPDRDVEFRVSDLMYHGKLEM